MKKNKIIKIILFVGMGLVVFLGLLIFVSIQYNNSKNVIDVITEKLNQISKKAIQDGDVTKGKFGMDVFIKDTAQEIEKLHREASNEKGRSLERSASERIGAIMNMRLFSGNPNLNPQYSSTAKSSYGNNLYTELYVVGKDYFEINMTNNKIVQFGPKPIPSNSSEGVKKYNLTNRFSPDQLELQAREFITKMTPEINLNKLQLSIGEKSGTNYFFRWTDTSRKVNNENPFVQIGFTIGGDILSYTNTLSF